MARDTEGRRYRQSQYASRRYEDVTHNACK